MSKSIRIISVGVAALSMLFVIAAIAVCAVFPNKYAAKISAASDEFGLDSALVKSVVWAESKFDARAVSGKGARGLMQLMPETYNHCAKALGISSDENGMFDAENSLRCGCYYLAMLIDKYDDVEHALMAYNAGEKNANSFIAGAPVFEETKKYVKSVALAKRVYGVFR